MLTSDMPYTSDLASRLITECCHLVNFNSLMGTLKPQSNDHYSYGDWY